MNDISLPLLIEPAVLEASLQMSELLILDLRTPEKYRLGHVPGALSASYADFVAARPPAMGMLPSEGQLSAVLSGLGLSDAAHVIAYDDEGGGRASRVLWTLDVLGHLRLSLLNGGMVAWEEEDYPTESTPRSSVPSEYPARFRNPRAHASRDWVLGHLNRDDTAIVDTRTPGEYAARDIRASRGGHIPGAVNRNWTENIDRTNNTRLLPDDALRSAYASLGVTPEKKVVVYCQTHHRSAHSYVVLKHLGYPRVSGYAGAWSEWGNDANLPIEQ